jgi:hypothetical protein
MMAQQFERQRMLCAAIALATDMVGEPIEVLQVKANQITCLTETKRVSMTYHYANAYSADGAAMPGSGSWQFQDQRIEERRPLRSRWKRALTFWVKSR